MRRASIVQSKVSPVPPRSPSRCVSSRWKSVWNAWIETTSDASRTDCALITFAPVRRATSLA